jgi:ferredoxin
VTDITERKIGDLTVRIDRSLCVGFGDCVDPAADVFALDDEEIAVFKEPAGPVNREQLLKVCDVCPVDALEVWDEEGNQLVP